MKFDLVQICALTVTTESKKHLSRNTAQTLCHWGKLTSVILNMGRWIRKVDLVAVVFTDVEKAQEFIEPVKYLRTGNRFKRFNSAMFILPWKFMTYVLKL